MDVARDRIPAQVRLETRSGDGPWRAALPDTARHDAKAGGSHFWYFPVPETGIEALLKPPEVLRKEAALGVDFAAF